MGGKPEVTAVLCRVDEGFCWSGLLGAGRVLWKDILLAGKKQIVNEARENNEVISQTKATFYSLSQ